MRTGIVAPFRYASVAVLTRGVNLEWESAAITPGTPLLPGLLKLKSGIAQIEFYQGARVVIEGPAELQLISSGEATCTRGKLSANVPPQAKGFRINTPKGTIVDLGTGLYAALGILMALIFIGLPFVVRTVQPILEDLDTEFEEAAVSLGANRWQAFRYVVFPTLLPALLTGFAMAFARAVGEYGSVIFIAGNIPLVSEITPLMIITKLEQYDYAGATAIAVVMLIFSFVLLLIINGLQAWTAKRTGRER